MSILHLTHNIQGVKFELISYRCKTWWLGEHWHWYWTGWIKKNIYKVLGVEERSFALSFSPFNHLFRPGPGLFVLGFTPFTTFHFLQISLSQLFLSFLSTVVIQDYKEKTIFLKHNIFMQSKVTQVVFYKQ